MSEADIVGNILGSRSEDQNSEKKRNPMNDSLIQLDNKILLIESNIDMLKGEEIKEKEKNAVVDKFSSIPNMMKCYICEDYCEEAVQIVCCYENFCDKHIKEEIMKNFTCPNCKAAATMRDVVPNKKLRENINWFKSLLNEPLVMNTKMSGGGNINPGFNYNAINAVPVKTNYIQQNTLAYHNVTQVVAPVRKLDNLEKLEMNTESDMTPEEKMQLYHKLNEAESGRKPSEDKMEENKSTSEHKSTDKVVPSSIPHGMPYPYNMMNPMHMPIKPDPAAMMYYSRMNPMYYHMPMGYQFSGYPPTINPEDKKVKKAEDKSRSHSNDKSKNSDRHGKKKKRSRSRSRSRKRRKERDREREKGKEKEKERDKGKDRDRDHKDRAKDREKDKKKYK